jgi:hypothetical protein
MGSVMPDAGSHPGGFIQSCKSVAVPGFAARPEAGFAFGPNKDRGSGKWKKTYPAG